jgi:hypothetical protein
MRAAAWAIEERVLWRGSDRARQLAEVGRGPFERLRWVIEQRLVWPVQERTADWGHLAVAGALAAVAVAAIVMGVVSLAGGDGGSARLAVSPPATPAAQVKPPPAREKGPVLRGAPPAFETGTEVGQASSGEAGDTALAAAGSVASDDDGAAAASRRAVPAGPVAMKVARRFSEAFVFYEVGDRSARTEAVFAETTTPRLAAALDERPPRQPESIEVPRARVLNLVPGPRRGRTYTVSASLLRVGLTSELRLEMKKKNGVWLITDVRG